MVNQKSATFIDQLVSGDISWRALPESLPESERAKIRLAALRKIAKEEKLFSQATSVIEAATGKNCEQMIGTLRLPLAVVGPVWVNGKQFQVPLATTEGALVASVQRGTKAVGEAGGVVAVAETVGVTRAPVFVVDSLSQGRAISQWLVRNGLQELGLLARETSTHIELVALRPTLVGKNLFIQMVFTTGEAMGMNMVTIAAEQLSVAISERFSIRCAALSGNACVDKKPAWNNALFGRGERVWAEVLLPRAIVESVLKTTPEAIVEVVTRKQWLGSMVAGSMGFNAHYANIVAALFLATGQDLAHTVEGSVGITSAELTNEGVHFAIYMPDLMVGTVGGGTGLPDQHDSLRLLGLASNTGDKQRFAEIAAATVLCGELSLTAAIASHQLARAHQRLGRGRR